MTKEEVIKKIRNSYITTSEFKRVVPEEFQNDRDIITLLVKKNSFLLSQVNEEFRNDPEILAAALTNVNITNPIKYALPGALTEKNIDRALRVGIISIRDFSQELLSNKTFIIKYINKPNNSVFDLYEKLPEELKKDRDVAIGLVKNTSFIFKDLPEEFRSDPEILAAALTNANATNPIKYALPEALTEQNIDRALRVGSISTQDLSPALLSNKTFIIKYTKKDNSVYDLYEKLPEELKKDRDVVIELVKNTSFIFKDLSEEFRNDPEILAAALTNANATNPIKYALPEALTEKNIDRALRVGRISTQNLSPALLSNKTFIIKYTKKDNSVYDLYEKLPEELKKDRDVVIELVKNTSFIFKDLPEEFRSDPEILAAALTKVDITNPIKYALPGALTEQNIDRALRVGIISTQDLSPALLSNKTFIIKYTKKDNSVYDLYEKLPEELQKDRDVVIELVKNTSFIFKDLPEEFRSDPEILAVALTKIDIINPIKYALPGALTEKNIDTAILKGFNDESEYLLDNRYYVLKSIEKNPEIFSHASERLRNDKELINIALLFHPTLLYSIGTQSLTNEMIEYAISKGLEINEYTILNAILSSEIFVTRVLPIYPSIYKKIPMEFKGKKEFINIILSKDINNLNLVPNEFITDEILEYALNNDYAVIVTQMPVLESFVNRYIKTNPKLLFEIFLTSSNEIVTLMILQIMNKNNVDMPIEVKQKNNEIINACIDTYRKIGIPEIYINDFIRKVLNGEINPYNLIHITNLKEMLYATNIGNLFITEMDLIDKTKSIKNEVLPNLSYDTLIKTNSKQYNEIKQMLLNMNIDEFNSSKIALGMYTSIGYMRSKDLLNGKYGPVNFDKLYHLFGNLDGREVLYEPDNTKYKPILNEQLINLLFSASYKVINTPIRNFLNGYEEMDSYIKNEIARIKENNLLEQAEKESRINTLNVSYQKYVSDTREFLKHFSTIYSNWDIIEEEFLKKQRVSKLKLKLNISQVNDIVKDLNETRSTIRKNNLIKQQKKINTTKIPGYEKRDYPLAISDVFNYVGKDTQFTINPERAPYRAVELSRMMENIHSKKFPNVNINFGDYSIKVFNPQDRNILSAGYKSGCCFRPNGNADNSGKNNSLLTYCTSTEYGGGLEIKDKNGKTLMFTPILRNGNVLMLHSFESLGLTKQEEEICNEILKQWSKEVLKVSKEEEKEEAIVAVTMTDLHSRLDTSKCHGTLPMIKKFKIYDPNKQFDNMYTNLEGHNHYVIEFAPDKGVDDISYNIAVSKNYDYPNELFKIKVLSVTDEELTIIEHIITNKDKISLLANQRHDMVTKKEDLSSFELLRDIKTIQRENLELQRKLYAVNPNSKKDILTEYIEAIETANSVCDELKITRKTENKRFKQFFYSDGWYFGITSDNKLYGNYIKEFEQDYYRALEEITNNYGLSLEIDIDNKNIIGGSKK